MVPLQTNQRYMELFGFCPKETNLDDNFNIILLSKRFGVLYICIIMSLVPSISYILLHPEDTEVLITSLIPIVGFILVVWSYITFFLEGNTAAKAFVDLRRAINDRKFALMGILRFYGIISTGSERISDELIS